MGQACFSSFPPSIPIPGILEARHLFPLTSISWDVFLHFVCSFVGWLVGWLIDCLIGWFSLFLLCYQTSSSVRMMARLDCQPAHLVLSLSLTFFNEGYVTSHPGLFNVYSGMHGVASAYETQTPFHHRFCIQTYAKGREFCFGFRAYFSSIFFFSFSVFFFIPYVFWINCFFSIYQP